MSARRSLQEHGEKMSDYFYTTNKNARIVNRIDKTGKSRTETQGRDVGSVEMAVSTDVNCNSTNLFIDFPYDGGTARLNGHEARTLYRLLRKHYGKTGKSRKG
jgi:hypothetical protein